MRTMDVARLAAAVAASVSVTAAPAYAGGQSTRTASPLVQCTSQIGKLEFQPPAAGSPRFLTFAAAVSVNCASSAASFSLRLFSENGCRLRSGTSAMPYVIFSDMAARTPLLDCGPNPIYYTGKGSQTFMIYGRTGLAASSSGVPVYPVGKLSTTSVSRS